MSSPAPNSNTDAKKPDPYKYFMDKQKGGAPVEEESELSPDSDDINDEIGESYASSSKEASSMRASKDSQKHYKTDEKQGKPKQTDLFSGGQMPDMEGGGIDDDLFQEKGIEVAEPMSPEAADSVPLAPSEPSGGVISEKFEAQDATLGTFQSNDPTAKVFSPKKQVHFDENDEMPSAVHRKKGSSGNKGTFGAPTDKLIEGYSPASQKAAQILKKIEGEITMFYNKGETAMWRESIIKYCGISNEAAQSLNMKDQEDQKTALKMLSKCLSVLSQYSNKLNPFNDLYYETHNNIARCCNILGDINQSLNSLVIAMQHVDQIAIGQEPGSVTIIPELSLNICNAYIYLNQFDLALEYAQKAVTSSDQCIKCLTKKLDQPVAKDPANKAEQDRLSELYRSHVQLHIQGFRAKGQTYEKIKAFKDAIREYSSAKTVVENNFGTSNKMFSELVEQIQAVNVLQKTQSYTGKDNNASSSTLFGKSARPLSASNSGKSLNKTEKSTPSVKSLKKKVSPVRDVIQSEGESLDIRSIQSSSAQFERGSILTMSKSKKTEQSNTSGRTFSNLNQNHRRLKKGSSSTRILVQSTKERPSSASQIHSYELRQPPMNAGGNSSTVGFNKMSHLNYHNRSSLNEHYSYIGREYHNHHNWRHEAPIEHKYVPVKHIGPYPHVQTVQTRTRLTQKLPKIRVRKRSRSQSSNERRVVKIKNGKGMRGPATQSSDEQDPAQFEELHKMRDKIKKRELTDIEDRLKVVQDKQADQQKSVLAALEAQRAMIIENQQREREIARLEREAMMGQQSQVQVQECAGFQSQQPMMPQYVHPQYGPAVFDYTQWQWTYPYAQWYGPYASASDAPEQEFEEQSMSHTKPQPERVKTAPPPAPPKVDLREFSAQKDFDEEPKPQVREFMQQTSLRNSTAENSVQTANVKAVSVGTSPEKTEQKKAPPKKEKPVEQPKNSSKYTEDQAYNIITKKVKRNVMKKREHEYKSNLGNQGVLFVEKKQINKMSGAMEIMSLFMEHDSQKVCLRVKFTIFDYASKQYKYFGVYEKLKGLGQFNIDNLLDLSKSSLEMIEFEKAPFRLHILCLQSIINSNLHSQREIEKMKKQQLKEEERKKKEMAKKAAEPKPVVQSKPQIVEQKLPQKKPTASIQVQTEDSKDGWELKMGPPIWNVRYSAACKIQAFFRGVIARKTYGRLYKLRYNFLCYSFFIKKQFNRGHKCFLVELYKHIQSDGNQFYTLRAQENKKSRKSQKQVVTQYKDVRLPDDNAMLCYYMQQATLLKINQADGQITVLMLQRMRIQNFKDFSCQEVMLTSSKISGSASTGCQQKLEFGLSSYPNHVVKVYKRIRFQSATSKIKIKDWKIEVTQLSGAKSSDYLVVRRLPCPLGELEEMIQNSLGIQYNKRIVPASILHLFWEVRCITIYSQSFYDLNSLRFTTTFHSQYHFSQNPDTLSRIPTPDQISNGNHDPLYEIYIQKLIPKQTTYQAHRYRTEAQQKRKKILREHLFGLGGLKGSLDGESSSDSEEESDAYKYKDDQCYWDEGELEKMQLDEENCRKTYLKVTCSRTIDKQDQDYFKIEESTCRFAHPHVEYQYLMENLILRQVRNQNTGEININVVGLKIRNNEQRFMDDSRWISSLKNIGEPEMFISQDVQRWKNQNIACSIHNLKYQGGGYLVEAINVDKPHERSYIKLPSLRGMRGQILTYYIDSCLKFFSQEDQKSGMTEEQLMNVDQTTGFGSDKIEVVAFSCGPDDFKKRMERHVVFKNWTYEAIDDQEYEAGGDMAQDQAMQAMMSAKLEEERIAEEKKISQEMNDKRMAMKRQREEKKSQAATRKAEAKSQASASQKVESNSQEIELQEYIQKESAAKAALEGELISKFVMKCEVTANKFANAEITITKFTSPFYFKIDIINVANQSKDDTLSLKVFRLPGNEQETDKNKISQMFVQKLRIMWQPDGRMQNAQFIDSSIVQEETIGKITDAGRAFEAEFAAIQEKAQLRAQGKGKPVKKMKKEVVPKEEKRSKTPESDSDFDKSKVSKQEYKEIRDDVKLIKQIIKQITQKTMALPGGVEGWFKHFDQDNSDMIELNEFIAMIKYIDIVLEDRIGIMLFRIFDRSDQGHFGQTEFLDIIDKRMLPNYKRMVSMERERFKMHGLDIKLPKKKKTEVKIQYRDRILTKEVPVEKIVEKIVEVEKIVKVDNIIEKIVEKPTYVEVEKIVEREVYISQPGPPQQFNYGAPPQQYNYGAPPQQYNYGAPPQQFNQGPPQGQFVQQQQQQIINQAPPQQQVIQQQPPPQQQVIQQQPPPQQQVILQQTIQQSSQMTQQNVQNVTNVTNTKEQILQHNEMMHQTNQGVKNEYKQAELKSEIKQSTMQQVKDQHQQAEVLIQEKQDVSYHLGAQVQDIYDENKPVIEKVNMEEQVKRIQFRDKELKRTNKEAQLLHKGVQIGFKPGQIIIQADWKDQGFGQKQSKLIIQVWRGEKPQCIFEQDIFGYFDRSGKQTKKVYSASDEVVRIGQAGDWYKIFGFVATGGAHTLNVKLFDMTIMAEFDPNREKNIHIQQQATQMASLLMSQKKGLITVDNVKIGMECQMRQDWPEAEYGRFMSFHGPKSLRGVIISFCDAQNQNFGTADANAAWHNREYVKNGRLSETHTVIVKWEKYTKQPHQQEDDRVLSEQQGSYRIGHQGQYWLEMIQTMGPHRQQKTLTRAEISQLNSDIVNNAKMIFEKVDRDKSGSIEYKEFNQVMVELGYTLSSFEMENLLKQLDFDGSGRVEFEEFITHIWNASQQREAQAQFLDWDDDENQKKALNMQTKDVFTVKQATMSYTIFSGKNKDYYMSCETKHKNQIKLLYQKVLVGDKFEEAARQELRAQGTTNPNPAALAKQIGDMFRVVFEKASFETVRTEQDPDDWMEELKNKIKSQVAQ